MLDEVVEVDEVVVLLVVVVLVVTVVAVLVVELDDVVCVVVLVVAVLTEQKIIESLALSRGPELPVVAVVMPRTNRQQIFIAREGMD